MLIQGFRARRAAQIIARSGRFDRDYYRRAYPDVADAGTDPIWHYVMIGHIEMRNPRVDFDTRFYVAMNPALRDRKVNPFVHYLTVGMQFGSPAGFKRTLTRPKQAGAAGRHKRAALTVAPGHPEIAVVLHLFYKDLWPEIQTYLNSIDVPFDLYVSVSTADLNVAISKELRSSYPGAIIRETVNRGRDIAPFLAFLNDGSLSGYRYVCKIHTKKSLHLHDGDHRRRLLLHDLLASNSHLQSITRILDADPQIGIAGPASGFVENDPHRHSNIRWIELLCDALDIQMEQQPTGFFAGSMFWFRPAALEPLASLQLTPDAFEPELGQVDGTVAHAIERMFLPIARNAGFTICQIGATPDSCRSAASS